MILKKFTRAFFKFLTIAQEMGHYFPNLTLFRRLFWGFWPIPQLIDKNLKNALVIFFKIILRAYLPNFRSISWLWPEKTGQTSFFVRAKNVEKGQKWAKKVNFFTSKLNNQYYLINCTSGGQHCKFEVVWSIGLEIIAI